MDGERGRGVGEPFGLDSALRIWGQSWGQTWGQNGRNRPEQAPMDDTEVVEMTVASKEKSGS
jgi:hypothetical protein